jgi:anti-sigma factor RsiW
MRTCDLFDKYRDGELDDSRRNEFESHLAVCEDCRTSRALLGNLVCALQQEKMQPLDLADQLARKALQGGASWDALVASWFRPRFAMAAVGLTLVLFSFLWLGPGASRKAAYTEYETLLNEAEASNLAGKLLVNNDSELVLQLAQGGNIQ